jgi:hypothetical protein
VHLLAAIHDLDECSVDLDGVDWRTQQRRDRQVARSTIIDL